MDQAQGKFAPAVGAALFIPGVAEAAVIGAGVVGGGYLLYRGGSAVYNYFSGNDNASSTVDTAKKQSSNQKENAEAAKYIKGMNPDEKREFHDTPNYSDSKNKSPEQMREDRERILNNRNK